MGHQHLGRLPRTKEWAQVIALISGGAAVAEIAAASSIAAERSMMDASNDPAVRHAFWLLTQIPSAAREEDFGEALQRFGLGVTGNPSLVETVTATMQAIDNHVAKAGRRTDFGEMAQLCAAESLYAVAGAELPDLFGVTPDRVKKALAGLASVRQFAVLSRDFFSRLTRRHLNYFLSRELSSHVGTGRRFPSIREHREFDRALELHCREASRVIKEYSGEWFSKHTHEGEIDPGKAGRFVHVASKKIRQELRQRRGASQPC